MRPRLSILLLALACPAFGQNLPFYGTSIPSNTTAQVTQLQVSRELPNQNCAIPPFDREIAKQDTTLYVWAAGLVRRGDVVTLSIRHPSSRTVTASTVSSGFTGSFCIWWTILPYRTDSLSAAGNYTIEAVIGLGSNISLTRSYRVLQDAVPPKVTLEPSEFRFDYQRGAPPPELTAQVTTSGSPVQWSFAARGTSFEIWQATPNYGTNSGSMRVSPAYLSSTTPDGTKTGEFVLSLSGTDITEIRRTWTLNLYSCVYTFRAPSFTIPPEGGSVEVAMSTQPQCRWQIKGLPSWLTLSVQSGTGPMNLTFTAAPNRLPDKRQTLAQIGFGSSFIYGAGVSQDGWPAPPPSNLRIPAQVIPTRQTYEDTGCDPASRVTGFLTTDANLRAWVSADVPANTSLDVQWSLPNNTRQTQRMPGRLVAGRFCQVAQLATVMRGDYVVRVLIGSRVMAQAGFRVLSPDDPRIEEQGIVDRVRGDWEEELVAGGQFVVKGSGLAPSNSTASSVPLPFELSDVQVYVNQQAVPLISVSPASIVAQLPWSAAGKRLHVEVLSRGRWSNSVELLGVTRNPGIIGGRLRGQKYAQAARYSRASEFLGWVSPETPALPGESLVLSASGLGIPPRLPADGDVSDGTVSLPAPPVVRIGGSVANVLFAVLGSWAAPDGIGEWLVVAEVPAWSASGDMVPIEIVSGGRQSPSAYLSVLNVGMVLPSPRLEDLVNSGGARVSQAEPGETLFLRVSNLPAGLLPKVHFSDGSGWSGDINPELLESGFLRVTVPPYIRGLTDLEGALSCSLSLTVGDQSTTSNALALKVLRLPEVRQAPGELALRWLETVRDVYMQSYQDLLFFDTADRRSDATRSLRDDLMLSAQTVEDLLAAIRKITSRQVSSVTLGVSGGVPSVVNVQTLRLLDRQIAAILKQNAKDDAAAASFVVNSATSAEQIGQFRLVGQILSLINPLRALDDWLNDREPVSPYALAQQTWNEVIKAGAESFSEAVDQTYRGLKKSAEVMTMAGWLVAPEAALLHTVAKVEATAAVTQFVGQVGARWLMRNTDALISTVDQRAEFERIVEQKAIAAPLDLALDEIGTKLLEEKINPVAIKIVNNKFKITERAADWLAEKALSIHSNVEATSMFATFSRESASQVSSAQVTAYKENSDGSQQEISASSVLPDGSFALNVPPSEKGNVTILLRTVNGDTISQYVAGSSITNGPMSLKFERTCGANWSACPAD